MNRAIQEWLDRSPLFRRVVEYVQSRGAPAYLVGGAVRDALLGRASYDLDLAIDGEAMQLARAVADKFHGAYVPLDRERDVARVVVTEGGHRERLDLAGLRADGIIADLRARDYTVNAMALDLTHPEEPLLDPTGGQRDLDARILRAVRTDAFEEDPLRILRGVRLRSTLGFALAPETESLAKQWLLALRRISAERIRDELVQILELDDTTSPLDYGGQLGLWQVVLPELAPPDGGAYQQGREALVQLESLFGLWVREQGDSQESALEATAQALSSYRSRLAAHWAKELSAGRSRWLSLKLAALLCGLEDDAARKVANRFRFSAREVRFAALAIRGSQHFLELAGDVQPDPLAIYRYYREFGDTGVDGALLALTRTAMPTPRLIHTALALVRAWFDERIAAVYPPQLLSGNDLMDEMGLDAGPRMGELLELVREAQVQGLVWDRGGALEFVRAQLASDET